MVTNAQSYWLNRQRHHALIVLSADTVRDDAQIGDLVGGVSVPRGRGRAFTFTLTDSASGKFALDGDRLEVAGALTAGTYAVTVRAVSDGGQPIERRFVIMVEAA